MKKHMKTFKPFDRALNIGYDLQRGDLFDATVWLGMGRGNRDRNVDENVPGYEIQTARRRGWAVVARLNTETREYTTEYRGNLRSIIRQYERFFRRNKHYYAAQVS